MTDIVIELAYIAGLLDADGSFILSKVEDGRYTPSVAFTNCHLPTVERIQSRFGGHISKKRVVLDSHTQCYWLQIRESNDVVNACEMLKPYVSQKAQKLLLVQEYAQSILDNQGKKLSEEIKAYRKGIYDRYKG